MNSSIVNDQDLSIGSLDSWSTQVIDWKIKNSKKLFKLKEGQYVMSPKFIDNESNSWFIKFFPNGCVHSDRKYVSVFLALSNKNNNENKQLKVTYELSILNNDEEPYYTKRSKNDDVFNTANQGSQDDIEFDARPFNAKDPINVQAITDGKDGFTLVNENNSQASNYVCRGWNYFFMSKDIERNLLQLIDENGNLHVRCLIRYKPSFKRARIETMETGTVKIEKSINDSTFLDNEMTIVQCDKCKKCTCDSLHKNKFEKLVNNENNYDVIIVNKEKAIFAHKVFLSLKSKYFEQFFSTSNQIDLNRKRSNLINKNFNSNTLYIEINDFSENVILKMLKFIYVENIDDIEGDDALDLYKIAFKYKIEHLKEVCELELLKNISITNCIKNLVLSDQCNIIKLKNESLKIVINNLNDLIDTDDWNQLNFKLVTEIMRSQIKK